MTLCTRLAAACRNVKARYLTAQGSVDGCLTAVLQNIGIDGGHASGKLCAFLCAVTYYHNLRQGVHLLAELYVNGLRVIIDVNLFSTVTYVLNAECKRQALLCLQAEVTIQVSSGTGTFGRCHHHLRSYQGLIGGCISDAACQYGLCLCGKHNSQNKYRCKNYLFHKYSNIQGTGFSSGSRSSSFVF